MELSNCAMVVAHPDDEVLWFGSLLGKVRLVVMCYGANPNKPERAGQRRRVVENYPFDNVAFLDLPEPGFPLPPDRTSDQENADRAELVTRLAVSLSGVDTVFTHNAWGEYGHPDHLRVHAAIEQLRASVKFKLYTSNYADFGQIAAARSVLGRGVSDVLSLPIDQGIIAPLVALYKRENCWTWHEDWAWPTYDHFLHAASTPQEGRCGTPIQIFAS